MTPFDGALIVLAIVCGVLVIAIMIRFLEGTRDLRTRREVGDLRLEVAELKQFCDGTLKRWQAEKKSLDKQRLELKKREVEVNGNQDQDGPNAEQMYSKEYWEKRARDQGLLK
jgi:hypothetical protein